MSASTGVNSLEKKNFAAGQHGKQIPMEIKQQILYAIANIEYGSVEIVIHDGKVMQIECREKIRVGRHEPGHRK